MARVEVETHMGANSTFAKQLELKSAAIFAKRMQSVAEEVVTEVEKIIEDDFVTDRDPSRRKKGSKKLKGSIRSEVLWDGKSFPITIRVWSLANSKKVGALEQGSPQHYIPLSPKSGATPNDFIYFPRTRDAFGIPLSGSPGVYGKMGKAGGGRAGQVVKMTQTWHSGNNAFRFMRRGVDRVVDRRLRGAR
jgi:hypothetical protein